MVYHQADLAVIGSKRGNVSRSLLEEITEQARDADAWYGLGTINLNQGDYAAAREKFAKAMEIRQAIGDRAGEAGTWHNLATIDLNQGEYVAAREKFAKAMEIRQAICDRSGEAATWYQLGRVAYESGQSNDAVRLMAVAFLISDTIGNNDLQTIAKNFANACGNLNINQAQRDAIREEARLEYQKDRGQGLIERAFNGDDPASSESQ